MLNKIIKSWRALLRKKEKRYRYILVEDLPPKMVPGVVYLQTHLGVPWQAVMECPCGCEEYIMLNLVRQYRPAWSFKLEKKRITLSPSVQRTVNCRSHFFLRQGRVQWCNDIRE